MKMLSAHGAGLNPARFHREVKRFRDASVLVVGDFILDQFIWGDVERISPEAPVPVVRVQRESFMLGGALNVAHNILTLKGRVFPCGVVGRDLLGRMLIKVMRQNGVDTAGVVYDASRPTTQKTRIIAHSQQVVRFDREQTTDVAGAERRKILEYAAKKIREVNGVVIEDYGKGMITPALIKEILSLSRRHKKFVVVDPKEDHFSDYKGVTAITPNRKEAYQAAGFNGSARRASPEKVAERLSKQLGCEAVLMTLGEEGMLLVEKGARTTCIPTAAQEVYDVSGAGDTVLAVFSLALASGCSLKEAAFISNLAAGIVIGKLGTATVDPKELSDSYSAMWSRAKSRR